MTAIWCRFELIGKQYLNRLKVRLECICTWNVLKTIAILNKHADDTFFVYNEFNLMPNIIISNNSFV